MWEQIESNKRNSIILLILMAFFLTAVGFAIGELFESGAGLLGIIIAFIVWLILTLISFYSGDSIFLSIANAKKINSEDHKLLYNVIEEMQIASGMPKIPDIYIIDDESPNAFAVGRSPETASVAVTSGLLKMLDRNELQGVIAHEIAHITNRDTLFMTILGIMLGTIIMLADIGSRIMFRSGGRSRSSGRGGSQAQIIIFLIALLFIIIAPIVARIIYFAVSREREYLADAGSAQFTRYPAGLASALEKISGSNIKPIANSKILAPMYIVNKLSEKEGFMGDLFSTHPPTSKRIKVLSAMVSADYKAYNDAFGKIIQDNSLISSSSLSNVKNTPIKAITNPAAMADDGGQTIVTLEQLASIAIPEKVESVRTTTDLLWKLNDYIFIECNCGTNLKIPQVYSNKVIACPHCRKNHLAMPVKS